MNQAMTNPEDILNALDEAAEAAYDESELGLKEHEWRSEVFSLRSLTKKYREGKIQIPLCQRLYVWNKSKRKDFWDSIKTGIPCGALIFGEVNGVLYLVDGQQRLVSGMLMSNDFDKMKFTDEEKKRILDYKIVVISISDVEEYELPILFRKYNSGIIVATATKEKTKLSAELNNAILGTDILTASYICAIL